MAHSGKTMTFATDLVPQEDNIYSLGKDNLKWVIRGSLPLSDVTGADDLKVIEAISETTGLLKKTAANTWTLDTTSYATKTEVNGLLAAANAMTFKGVINATNALPNDHKAGDTYRVGTAGTYPIVDSNGRYCEVGTLIICTTNGTAANAAHWTAVETNEDGAVIGPANSTDNAIAVFSGTTGRIIKNGQYVTYLNHVAANAGTNKVGNIDGLLITGNAYGEAANLISNTEGQVSYGDAGPQIRFSSGSQLGAMIFDHYDSTSGMGVSFNFVTNQGTAAIKADGIIAKTRAMIGGNSVNNSYVLYSNGASYINGALTLAGALTTANNTWNKIGDDSQIGDINETGTLGIQGINGNTGLRFTTYNQTTKTNGFKLLWDGTNFSLGNYIINSNGGRIYYCKDQLINSSTKKIDGTANLTSSDNDDEWLKALLKQICIDYPDKTDYIFKGMISPNSRLYYEIYIYSTSTVDSTTKLPQYSFGTYSHWNTTHGIFGTNNFAFFRNLNIDSGNYTSYTVTKTGSGASGTWGINITGSAGNVAWANTNHPDTFPPSSHTHPVTQITWAGNQNLTATATANNQEWSIDLTPGTYTGTYWHVWSAKNSKTILRCNTDDNSVSVPSGSFTVSGGSASISAGSLWVGADSNTVERQIGVQSGAGKLYLYSAGSTTGNRGLYVTAHGTGSAKGVITIDTNNNATFTGSLSGNATSANSAAKWTTARTLSLTGSVTGSASIDGSGNVSITTTTNHNHDWRYPENHLTSYSFTDKQPLSRYVTFDANGPAGGPGGWVNGWISVHNNYLASYLIQVHRSDDWYVGWNQWSTDNNNMTTTPTWRKLIHSGNIGSQSVDHAETATSATTAGTASKLGSSSIGSARQAIYLNGGTATAGNYTVAHLGNAGKSNMNDVGRLHASVGMTQLADPSNNTDNPMSGTTKSTSWHLYWNANYTDDPNGSNAWVAQIVNKAGTSQWWVRSRNGGTITNGTAWAADWKHLVVAPQAGQGSSTVPIYIDANGHTQSITSYSGTAAAATRLNYNATVSTKSGLQYAVGQLTIGTADGNAKEGSNNSAALWSYPTGGTAVNGSTSANIQNLRLYWGSDGKYFRDIFISPNNNAIYHRAVSNGTAGDWLKILDSNNTSAASTSDVSVGWNASTTIATINGTAVKIKIPAKPTYSDVGAAPAVTGGYLPLSGGTLTGALTTANNTWNVIGDDCRLGDINKAGHMAIQGVNGNTGIFFTTYNQTTKSTGGAITWDGTKFSITSTTAIDGTITNSTWTTLLKPIASTTTASASTWNIPSGSYQVWGERFSDTRLKYTPSGGSETTITDTGDWTIWLTPNATSNAATLNMRIDGTYYGSFSGNLSGNASTATTATNLSAAPTIASGGTATVNLAANTAYTLTVGGKSVIFKTPADNNTATATDNILDGSNSGTAITYAPYTTQQAKLSFDTSTTAPTRTDRLNLNGFLYATKYNVAGHVTLQWNSTDSSLDFIFA